MRKFLLLSLLTFSIYTSKAQNLSFTCPRDTVLGCSATCLTITGIFPDLHSLASDYSISDVTTQSQCRPYVDPGTAGPSTNLEDDDYYSDTIFLPFRFPFYGSTYGSLVASTNGYLSFDTTNALLSCAWNLTPGNVPTTSYDRALIMGPWHDIDMRPTVTTSPQRQVKYNIVGTAPNRKWILSFYRIPLYDQAGPNVGCNFLIENTHQIILHESTGIIEVYIKDKQICSGWNSGKGMIGIQDWSSTKAIIPPGRAATDPPWGSIGMNETWRFVPKDGPTLYRKVQLLDATGTVVATGDTTRLDADHYSTSFPNICPPAGSSLYVIKTFYQKIDDPTPGAEIYSLDTINVFRQAGLPFTLAHTPTQCGASTGTITVTVTGGAGPYQYSMDGGTLQASNVFTNVSGGIHNIYAVDAAGCNNTIPITVTNISSLTSTVIVAQTSCTGATDGTITVTPTSGIAPYTYTINGGPAQTSNVFTGLAPATYNVMFTDAQGCTGTVTPAPMVSAGSALTSNDNTNGTSCTGQNNGTTTITPTSGTAPYTFSIDGGPPQPTGVFTGLSSGTHNVTFSDAGGCAGVNSIYVFEGTGVSFDIESNSTSCPGVNNGTITLTPLNGTGPYTYSLDGGPFLPANPITGVSPGIHNVDIKDGTGCQGSNSTAVGVGSGNAGTIVSTTAATCPGINDGTLTVAPVAGSGTAPYTYSLDAGLPQPTGSFIGVSAGPHTVVIKDVNGCVASVSTTITAGPTVTGTAIPTNTSCPGVNDGTITVTPGGTGPYTFTLNPGAVVQPNNPVFIGLAPNTYTISFSTGSGCIGTVTTPNPLVILAGPFLGSSVTAFNPPCANINDGTITISNMAGVAPYSFTLTGPGGPYTNATGVFSNLAPGIYSYTFTDGNGCTGAGSAPITLTTHTAIGTTVVLKQALCNAGSDGVITLSATGGVSPYQYALSPFSSYQATGVFNGLAAGTYTFRIKDNVGCTKDTTVTLGEPTVLYANAMSPSPASCSGNDGTIQVSGSGGTPPYQYSIDGINFQASTAFVAPAVGAYPNIKVKDANGCIANATVNVSLVDAMFLTLGKDTTICVGSSVTFQPQTNVGTSVYTWRPLDPIITATSTIDNPAIRNATATPADTAIYILNAQWGPCVREDTIIVNILHKPVAHAGMDTAICDKTYAILRGDASNLSGTVNYSWTPADSVRFPAAPVTVASPVSTQLYTLTVTDNYNCNFSVTDDVLITVQPPVPAYAGNDTIAIKGSPHQLFGSGGVDYLWAPPGSLNLSTAQNPLATLNNDQLFVLKVTDVAGCIGYDTVFVKVYDGPNYYVPNAFSPNGDGINDYFRAVPVGMAKTEYFRIFDRYGQLMFQTNEWLKGWDGRFKGKLQPVGVYVWFVKGTDKNGREVEMKGTVMIVQ